MASKGCLGNSLQNFFICIRENKYPLGQNASVAFVPSWESRKSRGKRFLLKASKDRPWGEDGKIRNRVSEVTCSSA